MVEKLEKQAPQGQRRVKTPTVLQMEAVECGAAALGIILAYHHKIVPLEELRGACGISRDGSKASNLLAAARGYGLTAKGYKYDVGGLRTMKLPVIIFWNFNHFLVLEGFGRDKVYLNDPAHGPRIVSEAEFNKSYTGVVLEFSPGPNFARGGTPPSLVNALSSRLHGSEGALLYAVLAGLCLVIPGLVIPTFTKVFVDRFLVNGLREWVPPLLVAMAITLVIVALLNWLQQRYLYRLWTKLVLSTSGKFLWHTLHLPVEFFTLRYAGDITTRMTLNEQVARLLSGDLATNAIAVMVIVFYAVLMIQYDILLTVVGVAIGLLNFVALRLVSRRRVDGNQRLTQEKGKLFATGINGLQTIETMKAGGTESDFFARWAGYQAKALNAQQELGSLTQSLVVVPVLLGALTTAVILGLGGLKVMGGGLSIGALIAFQYLMLSFTQPINKLVTLGSNVQDAQGFMNRLDDVLRYKTDDLLDRYAPELSLASQPARLSGRLELRDVTFGYSRLSPPLIENFSLSLRPGDRVALVGGSGSGKSTVAKLLSGLYQPWSGEVLFDGQPRTAYPRSIMTNSVAVVDQDIFMFDGTITDNLTLWDATIPQPQVVAATRDAEVHDIVAGRPGGYESHVEEGGANFSGGQRQRLEIARALVGNPSVLILDEATSALDPITEKLIDDNLRRRGCTCVIVAHRLSTIRDCEEIIVMDQGKVVERGTHEDLRAAGGPYSRLIGAE